jgi:plasmid stabilization system protein ParE
MRQIRHPLVRRDVIGIFDHILENTHGNLAAAERRLDEIDDLLEAIAGNPASGVRLDGRLEGWLARHGGRRQMITIVFRPNLEARILLVALIAFGGRNWLEDAADRGSFAADANHHDINIYRKGRAISSSPFSRVACSSWKRAALQEWIAGIAG